MKYRFLNGDYTGRCRSVLAEISGIVDRKNLFNRMTFTVTTSELRNERNTATHWAFDRVGSIGCYFLDLPVDNGLCERFGNLAFTQRALDNAGPQSVPVDAVAVGHSWRCDVELGPSSSIPPSWSNV